MVWKVSGWSGKFLDSLDSFRMVWRLSGWSGNFPVGLETFQMVLKVSGWSKNFLDGLETFWMVWKHSGWSGKFPDGLETFWMVLNFPVHDIMKSNQLVNKLTLSEKDCYKNIMMFMSRKRFTHFFDAFVAKTIYALRPESFCALTVAIWKVQTFWASAFIMNSYIVHPMFSTLLCVTQPL